MGMKRMVLSVQSILTEAFFVVTHVNLGFYQPADTSLPHHLSEGRAEILLVISFPLGRGGW